MILIKEDLIINLRTLKPPFPFFYLRMMYDFPLPYKKLDRTMYSLSNYDAFVITIIIIYS